MKYGFVGCVSRTATQLATLYSVNRKSHFANRTLRWDSKGLQPLVWVGIVRRTRGVCPERSRMGSPLNEVGTAICNCFLKAPNLGFVGASYA
jgi:hypothetical protein